VEKAKVSKRLFATSIIGILSISSIFNRLFTPEGSKNTSGVVFQSDRIKWVDRSKFDVAIGSIRRPTSTRGLNSQLEV